MNSIVEDWLEQQQLIARSLDPIAMIGRVSVEVLFVMNDHDWTREITL